MKPQEVIREFISTAHDQEIRAYALFVSELLTVAQLKKLQPHFKTQIVFSHGKANREAEQDEAEDEPSPILNEEEFEVSQIDHLLNERD